MINQQEQNYLGLLKAILDRGDERTDRTGVGTKSLFGSRLKFSLENGKVPALTTKKVFTKGAVEELLFFIRGETDTKKLEEKGVNIWRGNTSQEFLESRGLGHLPEGSMGKAYGFQWRHFGGQWYGGQNIDKWNPGVDQLKQLIDGLKNDPYGRRHIVTAWNPEQLDEMVLPACHMTYQCYVDNGKLSLQWYQRSVDAFLGLPFNILSYGLLTHMLAKVTRLLPGDLIFIGGDTHIYLNHIDQVNEQMYRAPFEFPTMNIKKELASLQDIEQLVFEDFEFLNYQHHPQIKAVMAI